MIYIATPLPRGKTYKEAARLLLREVLLRRGVSEAEIACGENGKPYLKNRPDIYFNLSGCPEGVLCAVGPAPVGVDVEAVRQVSGRLVRRACNEREYAEIKSSRDPARAFIRLWTAKESSLKLSGKGITGNIAQTLKTAVDLEKIDYLFYDGGSFIACRAVYRRDAEIYGKIKFMEIT
ncbi:MAG: 4'-phosphopantetheinyl transferase superfamily protein [Clostridiales bacterium]|jgi:phosphopantetheinyl transferase|nr:4'-phosphopantetheinyl transferase superfamily protein [Clostridiales bacterium]